MNSKQFQKEVLILSDRLFPMVARMLGNVTDAEDAIQDIMVRLWNNRNQLTKHPNIPGFIFLTARNYCLDILKKRTPRFEELEDETCTITVHPTGLESLENQEFNTLIKRIIKQLPLSQQQVIILRDIDGLEYIEIAGITQYKIEHVRVLLSRARHYLRLELEKADHYV